MHRVVLLVAAALIAAACGGGEDTGSSESQATEATAASTAATTAATQASTTTTVATTTTSEATTTTAEATTTTAEPEPALSQDGDTYMIVWENTSDPFYAPADESADSPFFFVHTRPNVDGFYFGIEMYTTGYGALWTGELGTVQVLCMEAPPAPNSTGICPWFDPDGPGPMEPFSAFGATGTITIDQLDADGYDITVNEIVYAEGAVVAEFRLVGP